MTRDAKRRFDWQWVFYLIAVIGVVVYVVQWIRHARSSAPPKREILAELQPADRIEMIPGAAAGCDVLVITMDTTRADHIGCYGNTDIETPVIDDLARRGVLFARAYTTSSSTLPGHSSIFTGLNPYHHGARSNGSYRLGPENTTLAEILSANGYATGAVIAAYVLDGRFGLDQGFDLYADDLRKGVKHASHTFRERPADYVNETAEEWLDTVGDQPFFLWVHYFDPHAPYLPPIPFRQRYARSPYDGEIAFVDSQIGRLLARLEEIGRLDNTLIVLAADHGEGLGEHGEATHSLLVYDSTLHTPLIICPPPNRSGQMGRVVERTVSNVDIFPTVLDLMAIETDGNVDGVSLLREPGEAGHTTYAETISTLVLHGWSPLFSIRQDGMKYIHAPRPELYDVQEDPGELENLFESRPEESAAMSQALAALIGDDLLGNEALAQRVEMDPETARALGALGYVGSIGDPTDAGDTRPDPKDMVPHFDRVSAAEQLMERGEFQEAVAELEACLEIVPRDVRAMKSLVLAYLRGGEVEKAKAMVDRVLELEKNDPGIYLLLSHIEMSSGRPGDAEQAVRKALEIDPDFAQAYVVLGSLYARTTGMEEAIASFEKAIEMDPGTTGPGAYCAIGQLHLARLELDLARAAFDAALEIDQSCGAAHKGIASILIEDDALEEAQKELDLAVRFEPNDPSALSTLASLKIKRSEFQEAIVLAERALDIDPGFINARNALGAARAGVGDLAGAREVFDKLLEEYPDYASAIVSLARIDAAVGQLDSSAALYQRALDVNPDILIALLNLGIYKLRSGDNDAALALFSRAVETQPDDAMARHHLGMLLLSQKRADEALPHLEETLRLDPDHPNRERIAEIVAALRARQGADTPP